jgi:hypothetical protein
MATVVDKALDFTNFPIEEEREFEDLPEFANEANKQLDREVGQQKKLLNELEQKQAKID